MAQVEGHDGVRLVETPVTVPSDPLLVPPFPSVRSTVALVTERHKIAARSFHPLLANTSVRPVVGDLRCPATRPTGRVVRQEPGSLGAPVARPQVVEVRPIPGKREQAVEPLEAREPVMHHGDFSPYMRGERGWSDVGTPAAKLAMRAG